MSLIGIKQSMVHGPWSMDRTCRGFTLVEVAVTASVLALGIVFIYQSFFISADTYSYCTDNLNVSFWIDEKIWQAQDNIRRYGGPSSMEAEGRFYAGNNNFDWYMLYTPLGEMLYQIDLILTWKTGQKSRELKRSAYAVYIEEDEESD